MLWVAGLILSGLISACSTQVASRPHDDLLGVARLGIHPARAAVLIPSTTDPALAYAYARLETMTSHLLRDNLGSLIVERGDLRSVREEQRWQYAEPAAEPTTARLGRLSGADTLIMYRILSPTPRERLFASEGIVSPVTIIGKVVRVETGEVVWNHLVSVEVSPLDRWRGPGNGFDPGMRQALDHGVKAMEAALSYAVQCRTQRCHVETAPAFRY